MQIVTVSLQSGFAWANICDPFQIDQWTQACAVDAVEGTKAVEGYMFSGHIVLYFEESVDISRITSIVTGILITRWSDFFERNFTSVPVCSAEVIDAAEETCVVHRNASRTAHLRMTMDRYLTAAGAPPKQVYEAVDNSSPEQLIDGIRAYAIGEWNMPGRIVKQDNETKVIEWV